MSTTTIYFGSVFSTNFKKNSYVLNSRSCNPASKDWMTILSAKGDGKCSSGVNREPVNFGVNMQSGCMYMYRFVNNWFSEKY